jgi:hypothetical protein
MCCGKKIRTQDQPPLPPRGLPPPPFRRSVLPSPPPLPRATIGPQSVPRGLSAPPGDGGSSLSIRDTNEVCPKCACKLGVQLRYSDRLRRHYEVKWCPTCKETK